MSDFQERINRLNSALRAIPGYGEATHLESVERWIEPGSGLSHEFVVLERPEYQPVARFQTESRTLSVDVARAFATILDELPLLLAHLQPHDGL